MKKIQLAALALPLLLSSTMTSAQEIKPNGLYIKGFYDGYVNNHSIRTPLYGVGLGYKLGLLRAEGKYGYGERYYGHSNSLSLIGNLDFDNSTPISPYLGLGIENNSNHYAQFFNTNDTNAVGTIGARAYINQNVAIDVGYITHLNSNLDQGRGSLGILYQF